MPVLMGYFIRGKIRPERNNPINRWLIGGYRPLLRTVLSFPKTTLLVALLIMASTLWPLDKIGSEFMPPLDEGDLMYMPTTYPGISIGKARELLQQTDRLIRSVPEVKSVFGKVGRAETATDPAPLTMIETFIQLKDRSQWRDGVTPDSLRQELDNLVKIPGLANAWVMPIKTRIDMLATGIKTPVGIKISGAQLSEIQNIGVQLEDILNKVPGTASVYSERVAGGRYINIDIDRQRAARYGINIADVQQHIASAVGGSNLTQSIEGLERYPINLRYPQHYRNSPQQLELLPIVSDGGQQFALGDIASITIEDGPAMIKSENARINGWVFVDIEGVDIGHYVEQAMQTVEQQLQLPNGYAIAWSGQYQYMQRAKAKLQYVLPLTMGIIVLLLFIHFRRLSDVAIILGSLPFAVVGSIWLMYWQGYNFSVAVAVGFIALAGVAVEIGVIMLVYLNHAWRDRQQYAQQAQRQLNSDDIVQAVLQGAGLRVRPVVMTAAAIILGLLPILYGTGTGSEIMSRIAAPMVGGMLSAVILTLLVLPLLFAQLKRRELKLCAGDNQIN